MLLRRARDIAGLFRDGRSRAGWSQAQLADEAGVSRQWISLVETGKTSVEFDLVVGTLQVLGYQLHVESPGEPLTDQGPYQLEAPTHSGSGRTPLTRHGERLGTQRAARPRKGNRGKRG